MSAVGSVLSTTNVSPEVGATVISFPAKSFPAPNVTVPVPSPAGIANI